MLRSTAPVSATSRRAASTPSAPFFSASYLRESLIRCVLRVLSILHQGLPGVFLGFPGFPRDKGGPRTASSGVGVVPLPMKRSDEPCASPEPATRARDEKRSGAETVPMTQRSAAATDVRGGDGEIDPDGRNLVTNLNSEFSKAGSESTATAMATNSIHAKAEAGGTAESTPSDGQNVNLGLRCSDRRRPRPRRGHTSGRLRVEAHRKWRPGL